MADPVSMLVMVGISLATTAAQVAISYFFPANGPRLKDLTVSSSTYGNPIPEVWGTVRVGGNMIWSSGITENKSEVKTGLSYSNQFTYTADFAMAFCRGPVSAIRRIWANGKLVYDATGNSPYTTTGKYTVEFHYGSETQLPDSTIAADLGTANTPPYRGTCYAVFKDFLLTDFNNQIPQMAAEVTVADQTALVPAHILTTDGTTELTDYTLAFAHPVAVDFKRHYVYLSRFSDKSLLRVRMSDGVMDKQAYPMGSADSAWADGKLGALAGVASDGSVTAFFSVVNNYTQHGQVDPTSLQTMETVGHAEPYGDLFPGDFEFRYTSVICYDGAQTTYVGMTFDKHLVFLDPLAEYVNAESSTTQMGTGLLGTTVVGPGPGKSQWLFLIQNLTGFLGTSITLKGQGVAIADYTIIDPDIGNGSTNITPDAVVYDTGHNYIIMFYSTSVANYAQAISVETETTIWTTQLPTGAGMNTSSYRATNVNSSLLAWVSGSRLWLLNTEDGTFYNRSPDRHFYDDINYIEDNNLEFSNPGDSGYVVDLPSGTPDGANSMCYDGDAGILVCISGGGGHSCIINVAAYGAAGVTLATIVGDLLQRSGLRPDQFDVTDGATTPIAGYGYAEQLDLKGILGQLQQIYLFDLIERDAKIILRMRGTTTTPDETISYKALAAPGGADDNKADFWKETRISEADIPASITLSYLNSDQDMEQATAVSQRILAPVPMVFSRQTDQIGANIVFTATDAKNRATAMLYSLWSERTKHESKLPPAYAYLDPTDLLSVNLADGRNYFERLMHTEFGADFSSNIETLGQDSGAYDWNLIGDGGNGTGQTINPPVPARPFVFTVPYLRDIDNNFDGQSSIYYTAVGDEASSGFNGAALYQAPDDVTFVLVNRFSKDAEWGVVPIATPPAARGNFALDWNTKVTIWPAVSWFDLQSIDDATLLTGANMCMLGNEVIQFRDAVQNTDGSWTIWNLLRGCRGTEWACDTHVANENFVFLSLTTVKAGTEPLTAVGTPIFWKSLGGGLSDLSTAPVTSVDAYPANDLKPYAPVQLSAAWNGGDIKISFARRTRYNGPLLDGSGSVPINEKKENYEVDIYNGTDVIRTVTADFGTAGTDFPFATYTAANIATDWPGGITDVVVEVYQMGIVGRGFGKKATLSLTGTASPSIRYWGASALTSLAEADILALPGSDHAASFDKTITYDCTGGKYPYFCYPQTFGTPSSVQVNGLPFNSFSETTVTVSGHTYNVLRFDDLQSSSSIVVEWQ